METEIVIDCTDEVIRKAYWCYWWRGGYKIRIPLYLVLALMLVAPPTRPAAIVGVAAIVVLNVYKYSRAVRLIRANLAKLGSPATLRVTDTGIGLRAPHGEWTLPWQFERLWRFRDVWLLFFTKGAYWILPTQALSDEVKQFIEQKVRENGGKVR